MKLFSLALSMWIVKAIRFAFVGCLGLVTDFTITYLCKERLRWNKFFVNSIGFSFAVIQNYVLNRVWTFNNSDAHLVIQFSRFLIVAIAGLALNNLVLYFFLRYTRNEYFYTCKIAVTGIVFVWNFFANTLYTFR